MQAIRTGVAIIAAVATVALTGTAATAAASPADDREIQASVLGTDSVTEPFGNNIHGGLGTSPLAPTKPARVSWSQWGVSWWPALHFWMKVSTDEVLRDVVYWTCTRYAPGPARKLCSYANTVARRLAAGRPGGIWVEVYLGHVRAGVWW